MNTRALNAGRWLRAALALIATLALANGAPAQTPNLQSADTACPDNYGITVRGTNFASDSEIHVRRAGDWFALIDQFSGSQLQRSIEGAQNVLRFTIANSSTRDSLNSPGLWLWVVNPSAGTWSGPVAVSRTAPSMPTGLSGQLSNDAVILSGSNVAADAYVHVRTSAGGSVLATYAGAQLERGCSGDQTTLRFTISDPVQRSYLTSGGLYFWVINQSAGAWNGPVHLQGAAPPPTVSLSVSPSTGLVAPAAVTMSVSPSNSGAWIGRVEFYRNGTLVATDYATPYSHYLSGIAAGTYALSARAYDNLGAPTYTNTVNISVGSGASPPILTEARTTGIDNFSVRLKGTGFANDAYVQARATTNGAVVAQYVGAQLQRSSEGGYNYLSFTVADVTNRGQLDTAGLYFWVINPSSATFTQQPVYAKRRVELRGGSNYNWHRVDFFADGTCDRDPYGIVKNYHVANVRQAVQEQLRQMYQSGQRSLRIALFFGRGFESGTVVNVLATNRKGVQTGGVFPSQYLTNLSNFLQDIGNAGTVGDGVATGFTEVVVGLFPVGRAQDYGNDGAHYEWWRHTSFNQGIFNEYSALIDQAYTTTAAAGIPFYLDLANEYFPPEGAPEVWQMAARQHWSRFVALYGSTHSIGFSVPLAMLPPPSPIEPPTSEPARRLANIARIYGSNLPPVLSLHLYDHRDVGGQEGELLRASDNVLDLQGVQNPLMIGETHYADAAAAARFAAVVRDNSVDREIHSLMQWPRSRSASQHDSCIGQNVPSPPDFGAYSAESF